MLFKWYYNMVIHLYERVFSDGVSLNHPREVWFNHIIVATFYLLDHVLILIREKITGMKPYTVSVKKFDQAYFEDIAKYSIEIFRLNVDEH